MRCEIDHNESSERSETLRVGSERFFSLSLERSEVHAKCMQNGPFLQIRTVIRVGQTAKVLKIRSSLGGVCVIYDGAKWGTTDKQSPN